MLAARDYYDLIAKPTVEEFVSNNSDARRGMIACTTLLHVVDHVFQGRIDAGKANKRDMERWLDKYTDEVVGFAAVRAFSLASKHAVVNSVFKKGFTTNNKMIATRSFVGEMVLGRTFLGDTIGGVTLQWNDHAWVNLTKALQATMAIYERDFTELTMPVSEGSQGSDEPTSGGS